MKMKLMRIIGVTLLGVSAVSADKIYNETDGLVIMEMENTDSPLNGWDFHAKNATGYPAGATGTGHVEYMRYGPDGWGKPSSPLVYKFKINKPGTYRLFLRAHKRLNPGDAGDKHNDCFVRMEGDFVSGSADVAESALRADSKVFGGTADAWGRATNMDAPGADHKPVSYTFKAGEIYTFIISGRSNQFNLDRIVFAHSDYGWVNNSIFNNQVESEVTGDPIVNAGEDKVVNLPASQVVLQGSASDNGSIADYSWTQVSGPNTAMLSGPATANLTASSLVEGTYVFRLTVTDDENNTVFDEVTVRVRNSSAPVSGIIEFDAVDGFSNGELNGQEDWKAESSWIVNSGGAGSVSTDVNNNLAVLDRPIQLVDGDTFEFSMDFEFTGTYAVPPGFVYAILAGLKADASAVSVSTGGVEPDVNVQLQKDVVNYRLLNNYKTLSGAGSITSGALDGGDQMRLEYVINMGAAPVDTTYTARLQNLTDGTDTGVGTVSGIDQGVYDALVGDGAYMFFQRINPANNSSGLEAFRVNKIVLNAATPNPRADAGEDQVVSLPVSQVILTGSGTDDGPIDSYRWTQVSGPNTAALSGAATETLTASALVAGTYVFSLTVTDKDGLTGTDEVSVLVVDGTSGGNVEVLGDKILWHKVTLQMDGPTSAETAALNPFSDYRMDVTFTHGSGKSLTVPAFFAADGDAANSGAVAGNKWLCHFRPSEAGTWAYSVSFRFGSNVAASPSVSGAALAPFDGVSGTFDISADNPAVAPDLRAKGRLEYVGKHHLRFAGSGEYFLKFGPDSPENFLEYYEFDNTPEAGNKGNWKKFEAHSVHYNNDGELWQGTKGKNILGALNYISGTGANSISMLLNNIGRTVVDPSTPSKTLSAPGDGARAFPFISKDVADRKRYDCSKLAQWEMVFDHAEHKGLYLHFKLAETEMARDLDIEDPDAGAIGTERKLYYREMVARFGHHLALNWNISEEIPVGSTTRSAWLNYLEQIDPWQNNRVFHTGPSTDKSNFYNPHLGDSELTGISLQTPNATSPHWVFNETKQFVDASAVAGHPWIVSCDEQGPGNVGVGGMFEESRKYVLWGNIMAGGGGVEYYWGGKDLTLDDYTLFNDLLQTSDHAVNGFFYGQKIPFWNMSNADGLLSGNSAAHCLKDEDGTYVVYLIDGGTASLNLGGKAGGFQVRWFDPRNGGALQSGSVETVSGGSVVSLGTAPSASGSDWAILVRPLTPENVLPSYTAWATTMGLAGLEANPTIDLDGDGQTNLEEYLAGTNPRDPAALFEVESMQMMEDDQLIIQWESQPNRVYSVSQATDLKESNYTMVAGNIVYPQNSHTVDVHHINGYLKVDVSLR